MNETTDRDLTDLEKKHLSAKTVSHLKELTFEVHKLRRERDDLKRERNYLASRLEAMLEGGDDEHRTG